MCVTLAGLGAAEGMRPEGALLVSREEAAKAAKAAKVDAKKAASAAKEAKKAEKAKKAAEAAWLAIPRASHVPATLFRLIPTRSCAVSLK